MKSLALFVFVFATGVQVNGQSPEKNLRTEVQAKKKVSDTADPFAKWKRRIEDDDALEETGLGAADMGMGGFGDMDMEGFGGGGAQSNKALFNRGLQNAINRLKSTKDEKVRANLKASIREAFALHYDEMIKQRTKDISMLQSELNELQSELKRRKDAKDRVVDLQLQSVQLAAEGLLDLGGLGSGAPHRSHPQSMDGHIGRQPSSWMTSR